MKEMTSPKLICCVELTSFLDKLGLSSIEESKRGLLLVLWQARVMTDHYPIIKSKHFLDCMKIGENE